MVTNNKKGVQTPCPKTRIFLHRVSTFKIKLKMQTVTTVYVEKHVNLVPYMYYLEATIWTLGYQLCAELSNDFISVC
jgi:hypothetical protein